MSPPSLDGVQGGVISSPSPCSIISSLVKTGCFKRKIYCSKHIVFYCQALKPVPVGGGGEGGAGVGAQYNRGQEGNGRREKKGEGEGLPKWQELGECVENFATL